MAADDAPDDGSTGTAAEGDEEESDLPEFDDEFLTAVRNRLAANYDLERDYTAERERFDMYGRLHIESQKQVLHPALNWANYESEEHLFVRRTERVTDRDLDRLVDLGRGRREPTGGAGGRGRGLRASPRPRAPPRSRSVSVSGTPGASWSARRTPTKRTEG